MRPDAKRKAPAPSAPTIRKHTQHVKRQPQDSKDRIQGNVGQLSGPEIRWQEWPEVRIKVSNLDIDTSISTLYELYKEEGHISRIELIGASREAIITFDPPPQRDFWQSNKNWNLSARTVRTKTARDAQSKTFPFQSHLLLPDRWIGSSNKGSKSVPPTSTNKITFSTDLVKFGVFLEPRSMTVMRRCRTVNIGQRTFRVVFSLDLVHKEIRIRFSIQRNIENKQTNSRIQDVSNYKMHIRLADISRVYQETVGTVESITIPLEKPAKFFCQCKDSGTTHEGRGRVWTEEKLWIRQTEIVQDCQDMEDKKLTLMDDSHIINIGKSG